jgi:CheY-like chemotaxis protein
VAADNPSPEVSSAASSADCEALADGGETGRLRILVVDDEEDTREALAAILVDHGYEVAEAPSGEEALGKLSTLRPDGVLTDLHMPGLDGLAFLQRAREQGSDAALLLMSAHAEAKERAAALRLGADCVLSKPVDIEEALACLHHALDRRLRR